MSEFFNTLTIEWIKVRRSKMLILTFLGFLILPFALSLFMLIYKYPEFVEKFGLLTAKANLAGGATEWPFYLNMYAQGIAIAGIIFFSLIISWVFGREFAEGTIKDLLAVPVSRFKIILSKFVIVFLWGAAMMAVSAVIGVAVGMVIGLDLYSTPTLVDGLTQLGITALMVIVVIFPIALFAGLGRGYLLPIGMAVMLLITANIIAVLGWGEYFPWSIPAIYAGFAGEGVNISPASIWIIGITGLLGIAATYYWWKYADHHH